MPGCERSVEFAAFLPTAIVIPCKHHRDSGERCDSNALCATRNPALVQRRVVRKPHAAHEAMRAASARARNDGLGRGKSALFRGLINSDGMKEFIKILKCLHCFILGGTHCVLLHKLNGALVSSSNLNEHFHDAHISNLASNPT